MPFHREGVLGVFRLNSSVHHNARCAVKATVLASGRTLVCGSTALPSDHLGPTEYFMNDSYMGGQGAPVRKVYSD